MSEITRTIIDQVKRRTGFDVLVSPKDGLQTITGLSMARGSMPAHVLQYRPDAAAQLDYLIVSQCSFILRAVEDVRGVSISHSERVCPEFSRTRLQYCSVFRLYFDRIV